MSRIEPVWPLHSPSSGLTDLSPTVTRQEELEDDSGENSPTQKTDHGRLYTSGAWSPECEPCHNFCSRSMEKTLHAQGESRGISIYQPLAKCSSMFFLTSCTMALILYINFNALAIMISLIWFRLTNLNRFLKYNQLDFQTNGWLGFCGRNGLWESTGMQ